MPLEPGQSIDGKYRVVRRIGEGGMGTVYEGENVRIGRRVAIKVLHEQVASRAEFAARFEREARAAAKIGSPHICDVLDLGDLPNGERFIVMEFLEGESLEARIVATKRMGEDALLPVAFEMLEALATMHDAGVIHRDLKPANVYLTRTTVGRGEAVKILDFGVSKFMPAPGESSDMTTTGTMMGTPLYMSPEQARGLREIDGRADIYSASVIFYRALTGVLPFTAENFNELMFKIALEEPKAIRELAPGVDPELAAIVHRGLARAPEGRWQSARAYQDALVTWAKTNNRLTFSILRVTPSEKALAVATARRTAPTTQPMGPGGVPSTPTAWSDDGPVGVDGTQILGPDPKKKEKATAEVAQTMASSGAVAVKGEDAEARSVATPPARNRWIVPAAAVAIVALGAIGWKVGARATSSPPAPPPAPPPAVAVPAPSPAPAPSPTEAKPTTPPPAETTPTTAPAEPTAAPEPHATHATTTTTAIHPTTKPPAPTPCATAQASAAPATPAPTASTKPRVFRTNLD